MGLESEKKSTKEIVDEYKDCVTEIAKYLPWLESKKDADMVSQYKPGDSDGTLAIPVFDPTLLQFIKLLEKSGRMDKNYDYVYKRYRIYSEEDEISLIHRAQITDMGMLFAVLSKYVIRGRTKSEFWKKGVSNGAFCEAVKKMKELIEFWDMPI
ncbi:MAG: hypothetical protein J6X45_00170 [Lachnospiraceae bacterium]|nr:hypothetical protein [Lachnospiraceae bacterium]MBQ4276160.1 hypothetical protein [Lachnospiraceae bacterium]